MYEIHHKLFFFYSMYRHCDMNILQCSVDRLCKCNEQTPKTIDSFVLVHGLSWRISRQEEDNIQQNKQKKENKVVEEGAFYERL